MTDLAQTIAPKSDQLNADDLIAGPMMITVTSVSAASSEQPIAINFEGDNGKPYKPCKSMRRVLVQLWGRDGKTYAGKRMTLYRDPEVKFGGDKVGGIRISHMSDIDGTKTIPLTATRGSRKPFTVKPLKASQAAGQSAGADAQADGVQGDRPSPPADDFPGDFKFQLKDSKGNVRKTTDGEQWASALEGMIAKAGSDEEAEAIFNANRAFVNSAEANDHRLFAQRVWVAAGKRGVSVE